jgi:GPH family glycoside/pentoside/hexuronide:cation symporter
MWLALAARLGKRPTYIGATLLYSVMYVIWALSAHWGTAAAYVITFVAAIGNSGWAMLGFSMMSDIAAEDERHAGLYAAAWVATDKIAFALGGTLLLGLLLSAFGFDSARAVAGQPQSAMALTGVMIGFGIVPAALNIIGAAILARWGRN